MKYLDILENPPAWFCNNSRATLDLTTKRAENGSASFWSEQILGENNLYHITEKLLTRQCRNMHFSSLMVNSGELCARFVQSLIFFRFWAHAV